MTFADTTTNTYCLKKEEYDNTLNKSITATYKKAINNIKKKINATGKQIARNSKVLKRMQTKGESNGFKSVKRPLRNFPEQCHCQAD